MECTCFIRCTKDPPIKLASGVQELTTNGVFPLIGLVSIAQAAVGGLFSPPCLSKAQFTHTHQSLAYHPQVRQGKQRGEMGGVFRQATEPVLHVAKLTLDHPKWMLDLGSGLCFYPFNFARGLVDQAALAQLRVRAAKRCNLPEHLTVFMLLALLNTVIARFGVDRVLVTVQQFSHLRRA